MKKGISERLKNLIGGTGPDVEDTQGGVSDLTSFYHETSPFS
jgi:hypothetical protein